MQPTKKQIMKRANEIIGTVILTGVLLLTVGCGERLVDVQTLRVAAEQGDIDSQCELGCRYYYGRGVPKDDTESVKWLHLAAEQGHARAQYQLGLCYLIGAGVPQDEEEGIRWYYEAGKGGHAGVPFVLQRIEWEQIEMSRRPPINYGSTYIRNGKPFDIALPDQNLSEALGQFPLPRTSRSGILAAFDAMHWNPLYTEFSYPKVRTSEQVSFYDPKRDTVYVSQTATIFCFNHELGKRLNEEIAKNPHKIRETAERGDAKTQFEIGMYYIEGWGIPEDKAEGMRWLRKSAERGYAGAVDTLREIEALEASEKKLGEVAEKGGAEVQYILGMSYLFGDGVPKNHTEAVRWLRKSAEQGHAEAQYELGVCYRRGESVPKDDVEAVKWMRKSAEQGYAPAQSNLGIYYLHGTGVSKDVEEAIKLFRNAADQGNDRAQCLLGECYLRGEGVPKNKEEAIKWFRKSAEQGYEPAIATLRKIEER